MPTWKPDLPHPSHVSRGLPRFVGIIAITAVSAVLLYLLAFVAIFVCFGRAMTTGAGDHFYVYRFLADGQAQVGEMRGIRCGAFSGRTPWYQDNPWFLPLSYTLFTRGSPAVTDKDLDHVRRYLTWLHVTKGEGILALNEEAVAIWQRVHWWSLDRGRLTWAGVP